MTMSTLPKNILENLLTRLGFEVTVEETELETGSLLNVKTEDDPGRLIGRQGRTLSDLQYLTNRLLIEQDQEAPKVTVDVGNYRTENRESLIKKANEGKPYLGRLPATLRSSVNSVRKPSARARRSVP